MDAEQHPPVHPDQRPRHHDLEIAQKRHQHQKQREVDTHAGRHADRHGHDHVPLGAYERPDGQRGEASGQRAGQIIADAEIESALAVRRTLHASMTSGELAVSQAGISGC
jgi:hypothetical protein